MFHFVIVYIFLTAQIFDGQCQQLSCGAEAACLPTPDEKHYYCLCPNDAEPPTKDFICPRRPGNSIYKLIITHPPMHIYRLLNIPFHISNGILVCLWRLEL